MKRMGAALAAAAMLALGLAGCATPTGAGGGYGPPGETPTPTPTESGPPADLRAAWLDDGRGIGIVTMGSSSPSCRPIAQDAAFADGVLSVRLEDAADAGCDDDLVARGTYAALPPDVDPTADLRIAVTGAAAGEIELAGDPSLSGIPGDETSYQPSAGWADEGTFLLLTWGSSGCVPMIATVEATGPSEVTVTFEDPPADQVCTMDMAPRILAVTVDGLDERSGAEAVLTGDEFDGVRVPIAGS